MVRGVAKMMYSFLFDVAEISRKAVENEEREISETKNSSNTRLNSHKEKEKVRD